MFASVSAVGTHPVKLGPRWCDPTHLTSQIAGQPKKTLCQSKCQFLFSGVISSSIKLVNSIKACSLSCTMAQWSALSPHNEVNLVWFLAFKLCLALMYRALFIFQIVFKCFINKDDDEGSSLGTPASSHNPKTSSLVVTLESKGVHVWVCVGVIVWPVQW